MKRDHHTAAFQEYSGSWRDRSRRIRRMIAAVAGLLFAASSILAEQKPNEYQVEAVYLYNFGRFVEWPAKAATTRTDAFTVCVLGEDPFGRALDATFAGATIENRSVVARRISSPNESADCQILFLSSSETSRLSKIIESLSKTAVLTVSDMPQFSKRGGMIQFVLEGNRVRFEVNLNATQKAGLTLSSELLKVATAVRRNP